MSVHSSELAAAEAVTAAAVAVVAGRAGPGTGTVSVRTKGLPDHWKPWRRDGLDALGRTLGEEIQILPFVYNSSMFFLSKSKCFCPQNENAVVKAFMR